MEALRIRCAATGEKPVPPPVALGVARALGVRLDEALWLLARGGVLPRDLPRAEAERLVELLSREPRSAECVTLASVAAVHCSDHPTLATEAPCEGCRASICAVCVGLGGGRCRACRAKHARAARFKWIRVSVLGVVLLVVAAWSTHHLRQRTSRTLWTRTLHVAVIPLSTRPVPPLSQAVWAAGLPRLETWLADEFRRWNGTEFTPVRFQLMAPQRVSEFPALLPPSNGWMDRATHVWNRTRQLAEIDEEAKLTEPFDARIYVLLMPQVDEGQLLAVDGVGERGGEVGFVRAPLDSSEVTLELMAVAHELFHCLGATDKYDDKGHAGPGGLPDPERQPLYPQRAAELMVGELALGPAQGRVPNALDEIEVGPATAREVRWGP